MAVTLASDVESLANTKVLPTFLEAEAAIVPAIALREDMPFGTNTVTINTAAAASAAPKPSEGAAFSADNKPALTSTNISPTALYRAEHALTKQAIAKYRSTQAAYEDLRRDAVNGVLKAVCVDLMALNTSLTALDGYDGSDPLTLVQIRKACGALRARVGSTKIPIGVVLSLGGMEQLRQDLDTKTGTFYLAPNDLVKALFPNSLDSMNMTYIPEEKIFFIVDASGSLPVSDDVTFGAVVVLPSSDAFPHSIAPTYACVNGPQSLQNGAEFSEIISYPWGDILVNRLHNDGSDNMRVSASAFLACEQCGVGYRLAYTE